MFTFGASLLIEHTYGNGLLTMFDFETGIPLWEIEPFVGIFILFQVAAAFAPTKGRFVQTGSTSGPYEGAQVGGTTYDNFLAGVLKQYALIVGDKLGMTKEREMFIGRCAQAGLAASLIGEVLTSKGPLAQIQVETGVSLSEANPFVIISAFVLFLIAISEGTGKFVDE
ncbi:hypothetical protein CYMTET_48273 [Cymbomonas tetramitiformis]|uniref:Uncharacterized protein n=1 Tax=Cymbomonas tetramitiformis TaxID=36881 RepID=A0AAE0BTV7_9CHLO|nr:hypothetical protein CYMTET_48273 [Cymbomonas tetramitiformis]